MSAPAINVLRPVPPVYTVPPQDDAYARSLPVRVYGAVIHTLGLVNIPYQLLRRVVVNILCPLSFRASSQTHFDALGNARNTLLRHEGDRAQRFAVRTADGVAIDGMQFKGGAHEGVPAAEQRVVLCFNGNMMPYEMAGDYFRSIADRTRSNVFTINFRGGGLSEAAYLTKEGLYRDGEAALLYIHKKLGVPLQNIVVVGLSLGGGVATEVAKNHPGVRLLVDRSFSSPSDVATKSILALRDNDSIIFSLFKRSLGYFVSMLFAVTDLNLNSVENITNHRGPKTVIYSEDDGVIPPAANLGPQAAAVDGCRVVHLHGVGHNSPIMDTKAAEINRLFREPAVAEEA